MSFQSAFADDDEPDSFDLLGQFPTSEAASRLRPFQLRVSAIYGNLRFSSSRAVSGSNLSLDGVQAGARLEIERWFSVGGRNHRRSLGVILDGQFIYPGRFYQIPGDPVSYTSASLTMGWRLLGYGHTLPWDPELTLLAGPALEVFPAMTVTSDFFGNYSYTLAHPAVMGLKAGTRLRLPLFSRYTALEVTGYFIRPVALLGSAAQGSLSSSDTQSYGATALLDFRLTRNLLLGAGFYWGLFKLNYTPSGASGADQTDLYTQALILSLRSNI